MRQDNSTTQTLHHKLLFSSQRHIQPRTQTAESLTFLGPAGRLYTGVRAHKKQLWVSSWKWNWPDHWTASSFVGMSRLAIKGMRGTLRKQNIILCLQMSNGCWLGLRSAKEISSDPEDISGWERGPLLDPLPLCADTGTKACSSGRIVSHVMRQHLPQILWLQTGYLASLSLFYHL